MWWGLAERGVHLEHVVDDERRAEDVLRLQANPAPVDFAGLVVEGDLGRALADVVLGNEGSSTSG